MKYLEGSHKPDDLYMNIILGFMTFHWFQTHFTILNLSIVPFIHKLYEH